MKIIKQNGECKMGWSSLPSYHLKNKKTEGVREFLKNEWERSNKAELVDFAKVGSTAYLAIKVIETGEVFAVVTLTSFANGDFSWKDMSEDMMPYYFDCPKRILNKLSATNNEQSLEWRKMCAEKRSKNSMKYEDGDIIRFAEPITFTDGYTSDTFVLFKDGRTERFGKYISNSYPIFRIRKWKQFEFTVVGNVKDKTKISV